MYGIYDGSSVIAKFTAPMTVSSNVPIFVTDALSLKRHSSRRSAQRWEITSSLEPLSFGANKLFALLVQKGNFGTIQVVMPQNYGVIKSRTSTSTPRGTAAAGATTVVVDSNLNTIPQGTFIRFNNHTKVYMVVNDMTDNGNMTIFPGLLTAVSATTFKHLDDVLMDCLLDTDTVVGMTYTDGILMDLGTIKLVEKL